MRSFPIIVLGIVVLAGGWPTSKASAQERDTTAATPRPEYRLLRQEEDWSRLRERTDALAALKCRSLFQSASAFLTLGGEARAYAHWYRNEQWGQVSAPDGYWLHRLMLHSAIATGASDGIQARMFVQLKSGLVAGRRGPIYPPDKDLLGVNQAFLEMNAAVAPNRTLTIRVGRQELHYGAGRMIAAREGPNVRLGYDAVLARYEAGRWWAEAFVAKPNATRPGVLDNGWMSGRTLWGAYLRRGSRAHRALDLYYFGTRRNPSPLAQRIRAVRHTIGGRGHGSVGRLGYDLEAAAQFGRARRDHSIAVSSAGASGVLSPGTADLPIRAWMLAGDLTYHAPNIAGQPSIGLLVDLSSGDAGDTKAAETFAAPYPSGKYTGAGSRLGPGNLLNARPLISFRMGRDLQLQLTAHFFWRVHASDGIYAIWGAPLRAASDAEAHFLGLMPEVLLRWDAGRHVDFAVEASYFKTGAVLQESTPGRDMTHLGLRATYVF